MPLTSKQINNALEIIDGVSITGSDAVFDELAQRLSITNEGQKQHYEDSWARTSIKFEQARDSSANLESLLSAVAGVPLSNGIVSNDIGANTVKINIANFRPTDGHMIMVRDGKYVMVPNATTDTRMIDTIVNAFNDDTQAVVELGCGWGRNLAAIALSTHRRDLTFVGLEQSENGLNCTQELLQKDPTIQFSTDHFDFYNPDFSGVQDLNDIVVFSCAAIEQIAFIGTDFIDRVMAMANNVTLIFYEPIGWQRIGQLQEFGVATTLKEMMGNIPLEKFHVKEYIFNLVDAAVLSNAVSWSIGGRYNLNLLSVIQHAIKRQIVDMKQAEYDISGMNPFNPYSLIVLKKRK